MRDVTATTARRDWFDVGAADVDDIGRDRFCDLVNELLWEPADGLFDAFPAAAITAFIRQFRVPPVSHVAVTYTDGAGLYGIEARYLSGQTVRFYVLDRGDTLVPAAADVWEP